MSVRKIQNNIADRCVRAHLVSEPYNTQGTFPLLSDEWSKMATALGRIADISEAEVSDDTLRNSAKKRTIDEAAR